MSGLYLGLFWGGNIIWEENGFMKYDQVARGSFWCYANANFDIIRHYIYGVMRLDPRSSSIKLWFKKLEYTPPDNYKYALVLVCDQYNFQKVMHSNLEAPGCNMMDVYIDIFREDGAGTSGTPSVDTWGVGSLSGDSRRGMNEDGNPNEFRGSDSENECDMVYDGRSDSGSDEEDVGGQIPFKKREVSIAAIMKMARALNNIKKMVSPHRRNNPLLESVYQEASQALEEDEEWGDGDLEMPAEFNVRDVDEHIPVYVRGKRSRLDKGK